MRAEQSALDLGAELGPADPTAYTTRRAIPEPDAAGAPRPGPDHRDGEPEGRRRQDHDHHQPGRRAGRVRPQGAAGRLRPAGRALGRPGRQPAQPRPVDLQPADAGRRHDRGHPDQDRTWPGCTCCRPTSTCPRPRSSWSPRWPGRWRWPGCCARCVKDYDFILIDCQPSLGLLAINALTCAHGVLVPLECEFFSLRGVALLLDTHRQGARAAQLRPRARGHPRHHVRQPHHPQPPGAAAGGGGVRRQGLPDGDHQDGEVPRVDRGRCADHLAGPGLVGRAQLPPAGPRGHRRPRARALGSRSQCAPCRGAAGRSCRRRRESASRASRRSPMPPAGAAATDRASRSR